MSGGGQEVSKLRLVLDVALQLGSTTDLDVLLRHIVEAACRVFDCERATIFLLDRERHELYSRAATGEQEIRFPADKGIAGAAAAGRQPISVRDAYADSRFNPDVDRKTGFRTRNLLTFPLVNLENDVVGVLQGLNKRHGDFDEADLRMAEALGAQAGVAVHRWFLLQEYAEKQRLARDLQIARQIQQQLFPDQDPTVEGYDVAGWNKPADETGGDCYDFFPLDDGRLAVLLADATGHGIGAALVMAQCRSLVRAMLSVTDDLEQIAGRVNELLSEDLSDDRFVTAFFGILDPRSHMMPYISGGQGPLIFFPAEGPPEVLRASGLPFAVLPDAPWTQPQPFRFTPGSLLALLTDGFLEAAGATGELFGESRVIQLIADGAGAPLPQIVERLHAAVVEHTGQQPQADDLTAVMVRRNR